MKCKYMIKYEISSYFGLWKTWYNDKRPVSTTFGTIWLQYQTILTYVKYPTYVFESDENEIQD